MMEWFTALQTRERYLIGVAGIVVLLTLLYTLVWDPVASGATKLEKSVSAQKNQLVWMNNARAEIRQLKGSGGNKNNSANRKVSLITAVETSAKRAGVRKTVTRMEPQGSLKITVELKNTDFGRLISWVEMLSQQYGAAVSQFSSSKTDTPGLVNARLIFSREKG